MSERQLRCLTQAGARVPVLGHPRAAGAVGVTGTWVVLNHHGPGPAPGPVFGHWLSTQQEIVFAAAYNLYR